MIDSAFIVSSSQVRGRPATQACLRSRPRELVLAAMFCCFFVECRDSVRFGEPRYVARRNSDCGGICPSRLQLFQGPEAALRQLHFPDRSRSQTNQYEGIADTFVQLPLLHILFQFDR